MSSNNKLRKVLLEILTEWEDELKEIDISPTQSAVTLPEHIIRDREKIKTVLSVKDLSEYLGVSSDSIYTMVRENQIPYVRVRRRILFHRELIEGWLKTQTNQ